MVLCHIVYKATLDDLQVDTHKVKAGKWTQQGHTLTLP